MNILELFARIGLKADQAPADAFAKSMKGIKGEIIGAIAGTLSLAGAIKAVNSAMGDALELKKFSDATGASTDSMQRWRAVADQVSGSGAAVGESIKAIVSNQDKIKLGQGNISGYQLLGIDPRSDPFKVLEQIRSKTANLSAGMRRNIMGQFGVSTELISTLDLTNKQFDRMAAKAYVISPSMIDGMNRARGSMETLKNQINYVVADLATKFGPVIEKVTGYIGKFVGFIANGIVNLDKFIRSTIGWKTVIMGVVAALAVMNAGFLLSPIGMFTAAILVLMAILDDIAGYNAGKHSLFGVLLDTFPALTVVLKPLAAAIDGILTAIRGLVTGDWSAFDALVAKWGKWGDIISAIVKSIANLSFVVPIMMSSKNPKEFFDKMGKGTFFDPKVLAELAAPDGKPIPAPVSGAPSIVNHFNISGNYDAEGLTQKISDHFARQYRNVQTQTQGPKKEKG